MIREIVGLRVAPAVAPASIKLLAILRALLTGGSLTTRLVVAGTLLAVGLPLLSIMLYVWGYPVSPVPLALVVIVDGLQVLIVVNAIVVAAQLIAGAGLRVPRRADTRPVRLPARESQPRGLREWSRSLAEMIWEQERRSGTALAEAVLAYVRDAVTVELEHRRRTDAIEHQMSKLEPMLREGCRGGVPGPVRR